MTVTTETAERERVAFAAVELARNPGRPRALQVIAGAFTEWTELRGDRLFGDDRAVVGGPALLGDRWVMVVGQEKGTDAISRALHNFGMPHPEGYRKAQRLMRTAEKFGMPVVCLVDTPAAHAGVGAEERGQAWAIAQSLITMLELRVPVVSAVLSEGGSGRRAGAGARGPRARARERGVHGGAAGDLRGDPLPRRRSARPRGRSAAPWCRHRARHRADRRARPRAGSRARTPMPSSASRRCAGRSIRHLDELCAKDVDVLLAERTQRYRRAGDVAALRATSFASAQATRHSDLRGDSTPPSSPAPRSGRFRKNAGMMPIADRMAMSTKVRSKASLKTPPAYAWLKASRTALPVLGCVLPALSCADDAAMPCCSMVQYCWAVSCGWCSVVAAAATTVGRRCARRLPRRGAELRGQHGDQDRDAHGRRDPLERVGDARRARRVAARDARHRRRHRRHHREAHREPAQHQRSDDQPVRRVVVDLGEHDAADGEQHHPGRHHPLGADAVGQVTAERHRDRRHGGLGKEQQARSRWRRSRAPPAGTAGAAAWCRTSRSPPGS